MNYQIWSKKKFWSILVGVLFLGMIIVPKNSTTIKEAGAKDGSTGTLQSGKALTEFDKTSTKEFWVDNEVELVLTQS